MASIRMSYALRQEILRRVGKFLPPADPYHTREDITRIFEKYAPQFRRLALQQIIPNELLTQPNKTFAGYAPEEYLTEFSRLTFIVPTIYLPKIPDDSSNSMSSWGEIGWRKPESALIDINLTNPMFLPHAHKCGPYEDNLNQHRNNIDVKDDLIDIFEAFAIEANNYLMPLQKHHLMHNQIKNLLGKFYTTKQLTDAWPEIEAFIPSEFLSKSINQKKAKPVPLTSEELNQLNAISKELLIQKMLKN